MLTSALMAEMRKEHRWSQQRLAIGSGVNKAYISEYESGVRSTLPTEMLERISAVLNADPAGRTSPAIKRRGGQSRLVLRDADGNEFLPRVASVHWTEDDGTSYSIYLGEIEP